MAEFVDSLLEVSSDESQSGEWCLPSPSDIEFVNPDKEPLCIFDNIINKNDESVLQSQPGRFDFVGISPNEEGELIEYLGGKGHIESLSNNNLPTLTSHADTVTSPEGESDYKFQISGERCMSKNAVAARENRKRKKQYVTRLEMSISDLRKENELLKSQNNDMSNVVDKLKTEVDYLKNIIANQSTLSQLIGQIHKTPGIRFQSSFTMHQTSQNKENIDDNANEIDHSVKRKKTNCDANSEYLESEGRTMLTRSRMCTRSSSHSEKLETKTECIHKENETNDKQQSAGVCLHVASGSVSLEFCASCAKSASLSNIVTAPSELLRKAVPG